MRKRAAALLLTAFAWLPLGGAAALDRLRVEKTGDSVAFSVLDIGEEAGIWRAQDIAIESISAAGVRAQQLLASGDADIDLGAGTSMGFRLRGVPAIAVAALTGEPATFALDVRPGGSIRSVEDLKGKPIGVTPRAR
jgi:ABC-type nitrate/sulfonate/bicarbonate transport system substrate-binding protein